ncbi:hypothetical protein GEMRC1_010036 [Eukaryota sp. GEM-RC1]
MTSQTASMLNSSDQDQESVQPMTKPCMTKASKRDSEIFLSLPPSDDVSINNPILNNGKPSMPLQAGDHCSLFNEMTMSSYLPLPPPPYSLYHEN